MRKFWPVRCCSILFGSSVFGLLAPLDAFSQPVIPTEKQVEADWQDDRWNQMASGRVQASVVALPSGNVLKGLSVSVGRDRTATLCYDTGGMVLRAAWMGDLFDYSGRRYGTIANPQPKGTPVEWLNRSVSFPAEGNRWQGYSVHGERVVLEFQYGERTVFESPWWQETDGSGWLVREFTVTSGSKPVAIPLVLGDAAVTQVRVGGEWLETAECRVGDTWLRIGWIGGEGHLRLERIADFEGRVSLMVPENTEAQSFRVVLGTGLEEPAEDFRNRVARLEAPTDVRQWREAGPKPWAPLQTSGQVSKRPDAYVYDTITVPFENPWNALMFLTGVDFLPNGDAAVSTLYGDVWLVTGLDAELKDVTWHRYATGLFQTLGLQVFDGVVYALGRDQITALEDRNSDGFADHYRNFSNRINTRPGHKFVTSLEVDADGRFYYVDPDGLHRVSADGEEHTTLATGWRNPNGMGLSPDGILTVAPQQGGWTPSSQISEAKLGGFYGNGGPKVTPDRPLGYDAPLCWIPHAIDNSGGSQVWAADSGWGPLSGQMMHLSYGRCTMMTVLREVVEGQVQGGVAPLKQRFLSGALRGAVNPVDRQLYVVGTRGWQTSALRDGCFQRVRYTGRAEAMPVGMSVHADGIRLVFSSALDSEWAADPESFGISQWNYRYSKTYGSADFSVEDPDEEGRDAVRIRSARYDSDSHSVFLAVPDLRPVMQMEIRYNLRSSDGDRVRGSIYNTIHALGAPYGD